MSQTRRRNFWEKHVNAFFSSGQSVKEYCEKHNLTPKTFSYWKRKFEIEAKSTSQTEGKAPLIVPISLEAPKESGVPLKLFAAGFYIEVQTGFCKKTLREVLNILKVLQ